MRICVFGIDQSFGIDRVGGTDSFYRRLSRQWRLMGAHVSFVHYRCAREAHREGWHGIESHEFVEFQDALKHLETAADVVVVNALHRRHRLPFACFRRRWRARIKFFIVYSLFHERLVPRQAHFLESIVYPYSHGTLCMSPRLTRSLGRWCRSADLVWPPVGADYFCSPDTKPSSGRIRVTYIGRTEAGKGIESVIGVLEGLRGDPRFELAVHGYHFPGDDRAADRGRWLGSQDWLQYQHQDIQGWTPDLERRLADILRATDILLLPYDRLSSSIDTPLLLIEGMAASCCVLSRPFGDIPSVYGASPLLIEAASFAPEALRLIRSADQWLETERHRVYDQVRSLGLDEATVARRVLDLMNDR